MHNKQDNIWTNKTERKRIEQKKRMYKKIKDVTGTPVMKLILFGLKFPSVHTLLPAIQYLCEFFDVAKLLADARQCWI